MKTSAKFENPWADENPLLHLRFLLICSRALPNDYLGFHLAMKERRKCFNFLNDNLQYNDFLTLIALLLSFSCSILLKQVTQLQLLQNSPLAKQSQYLEWKQPSELTTMFRLNSLREQKKLLWKWKKSLFLKLFQETCQHTLYSTNAHFVLVVTYFGHTFFINCFTDELTWDFYQ